jgi:hypothetical protein
VRSVLWSLVVVVAVTPAIVLAIVPLALAYVRIQARYIATSRCARPQRRDTLACTCTSAHPKVHSPSSAPLSCACARRELKRLDSLALSPIFGHFSETLAGLATVRAFRQQPAFQARGCSARRLG